MDKEYWESYTLNEHEWAWEHNYNTTKVVLSKNNSIVTFHPRSSIGTAMVRGNKSFLKGRHHYWEIELVTQPHGTDMMIGVGTNNVDLTSSEDRYCSLLGKDKESWGLSYLGFLRHNGEFQKYSPTLTQGNIVGVHLDTWRGTLQFFVDKKPLGVAFTGLKNVDLYPMACSTAAVSKMKITRCTSAPNTLQTECLRRLQPIQKAYLGYAFPSLKYLSNSVFADILKEDFDEGKYSLTFAQ